jgi:hypothetical protein
MEFVNKINVLVIIGLFSIASCSSDSNSNNSNIAIESQVVLKINTNEEESNFLNTINTNNINLFYNLNNNLTSLNYTGDYPKGYLIIQEPPINEKLIKIFCYIGGEDGYKTTYIKWNENDMDTLQYRVQKSEFGNINISELKYNSIPIDNNNEFGIYNVIKN